MGGSIRRVPDAVRARAEHSPDAIAHDIFDADGDLILTGRSKDLIIRAGYNIAPNEIEDALHAHPAVAEAAVTGVPHVERLADNKVPRTIVFVDTLPYNQNAKVVKSELRPLLERAAAERASTPDRIWKR